MFLKKSIALLSIATLCSSLEFASFAPYVGKHTSNCVDYKSFTGNLINDKIYTFGGCYPIPYTVDASNNFDPFFMGLGFDNINTTDTAYVYDIKQDKWELETQTPLPLKGASTLVVGNDIYFFNLRTDEVHMKYNDLWKYDTITKEWSVLKDEFPFVYLVKLEACENNGIIYFTGTMEGNYRNIIHRYDTKTKEWISPLFLNKKMDISMFTCYPDSIQIGGKRMPSIEEAKKKKSTKWIKLGGPIKNKLIEFFTVSYEDGNTEFSDFNITGNFQSGYSLTNNPGYFSSKSGWQYLIDVQAKNSKLIKFHPVTKQLVDLGTFDLTLRSTFMTVYEDKEIYLLGGTKRTELDMFYSEDEDEHEHDTATKIKTLNHKLRIVDTEVNQQDTDSSKQTVMTA